MIFLPTCNNKPFPEYFTVEDLEELPQMIQDLKRDVEDLSKIPLKTTSEYRKEFETLVLRAKGIDGLGQGIIDQIEEQVEENNLRAARQRGSIFRRNAEILSIYQAGNSNLASICTLFQMHQKAEKSLKPLIEEQIQSTMKWNMCLLVASFSQIVENMLDFTAIEYSHHESIQAALCVNKIGRMLDAVGTIKEDLEALRPA